MAYRLTMPQLGESIAEGTVGRWLKAPGDRVERDEPLVEVVTDKVTAEVPSPVAGVLREIVVPEGATVAVKQEIAVIEEIGAASADGVGREPPQAEPARLVAVGTQAEEEEEPGGLRRSSPVVRRLAREYNVDLAQVKGTGLAGRVTKEDLLNYLAQRENQVPEHAGEAGLQAAQPAEAPAHPTAPGEPQPQATPAPGDEAITLTPMRRTIAERMVRSVQTAPHAWLMVEADVTSLVRWRESVREEFKRREGVDLSYVAFILKAVVEGLKEHPILNSTWQDDRIVLRRRVDVGVAVGLPDGIVVPVVRRADEKSIAGLAREIADLVARARAGRLSVEEVQGGTFTLNNTGAFGSIASQPIINHPQAAILNTEAIVKRPVVISDAAGDAIAIRSMMNLSLSFDHRILDGYAAGRFLQSVRQRLESFGPGGQLY